jgi:hypothetical protein
METKVGMSDGSRAKGDEMQTKIADILEKNCVLLSQDLDVTAVMPHMTFIRKNGHADTLLTLVRQGRTQAVLYLLNSIQGAGLDAYTEFYKALEATSQPHLAKILVNPAVLVRKVDISDPPNTYKESSAKSAADDDIRKPRNSYVESLNKNMVPLVRDLDVSAILPKLTFLTLHGRMETLQTLRTSNERRMFLLETVQKSGPDAYKVFYNALHGEQPFLAKLLVNPND